MGFDRSLSDVVEWLHPEVHSPARNFELPAQVRKFSRCNCTILYQVSGRSFALLVLPAFLSSGSQNARCLVCCGFRHPRLGFMNDVKLAKH